MFAEMIQQQQQQPKKEKWQKKCVEMKLAIVMAMKFQLNCNLHENSKHVLAKNDKSKEEKLKWYTPTPTLILTLTPTPIPSISGLQFDYKLD